MIALYVGLLIAILIYYILQPAPKRKQKCRVAKAGDVTHCTPLIQKINDLSNKAFCFDGENVDIKDYEVFLVEGESMHKCGIHTGNGVLVSRLFDKNKLKHGTVVIYEIDPSRYTHDHPEATQPQYGFKIRQFMNYADLSQSNEQIYETVREIDADLETKEYKELLFKKLDKARKYFENKRVTISITYKEEQKDYSIHSFAELYGIVRYIIPEEYIKN